MATIKYKDENGEWKELTILKGDSGVAPIINKDTNTWLVWDDVEGAYIDSGVVAGVGSEDFYASTYWVFNEMASGKKVIAKALTDRRYPTNNDESFVDMAQKITDMNYEEGWFAKIGYTDENDGGIQDAIDYSYDLAKGWNPDGGTLNIFKNNTNLIFAPYVDTSKYISLAGMYHACSKLISVPFVVTSNCTNLSGYYSGCSSLVYLQNLDTSNVVNLSTFADQCTSLKSFPLIDTHKVTNMNNMCYNCRAMTSIPCLDMGAVTTAGSIFFQCTALVYAKIINLGKSSLTTYDFSGATNWGTVREENRQSLIDSLITYSYDRASNGMSTATIQLSANTKALLTEEEIAQITNKGFTIS